MTASTGANDGNSIGVEIGPAVMRLALVDGTGHVVQRTTADTDPEQGVDGVVEGVVAAARSLAADAEVDALGIALSSQIATDEDAAVYVPNLRWRNAPFRGKIREVLDVAVRVTSDVRAATWAEFLQGAGRDARHAVGIFIGTGVGGAAVYDGRMIGDGEFGHLTVVSGGRECRCPNRGCLEAYVGGWAIADRAREAVRENMDEGAALIAAAGKISTIRAEHVADLHSAGDPLSTTIVEDTARYLADGVTSIVNFFNPQYVMIGGGIIERVPTLVDRISERVPKQALGIAVHELQIVKTILGDDATLIGAAAWARAR